MQKRTPELEIDLTTLAAQKIERMAMLDWVSRLGTGLSGGELIALAEYVAGGAQNVRSLNAPHEAGDAFSPVTFGRDGDGDCVGAQRASEASLNTCIPGDTIHVPTESNGDSDGLSADFPKVMGENGKWFTFVQDSETGKPECFGTHYTVTELLDTHEFPRGWVHCIPIFDLPNGDSLELPGKPDIPGKP